MYDDKIISLLDNIHCSGFLDMLQQKTKLYVLKLIIHLLFNMTMHADNFRVGIDR